jgi:hypothetical protein
VSFLGVAVGYTVAGSSTMCVIFAAERTPEAPASPFAKVDGFAENNGDLHDAKTSSVTLVTLVTDSWGDEGR